ncbi:MAG: DUF523 domain-containing protein [Thermodesulfovibrionales bacterium]|nr:DUF523 domain-containing protein [Thermodesulfovibrionales bacterium]
MFLVSACLAGFNTRYNGTNSEDRRIVELVSSGKAIPVCPEQLGGLPTPRPPVQFTKGNGRIVLDQKSEVVDRDGIDYTESLVKGAEEVLRIAGMFRIKRAIFKDGSPSCGVTYVWVSGEKRAGKGVTTGLLEKNGIEVKTIDSL